MKRMLQRAQAAALTDVTVEWGRDGETLKASFGGASSVDQSPAQVGSIFEGEPLIVYGLAPRRYDKVTVWATTADGARVSFDATAKGRRRRLAEGGEHGVTEKEGGAAGGEGEDKGGEARSEILQTLAAR